MSKLTDSQLIVLSAAAARDDGLAIAPAKMNKAAAAKVRASLVARKLMREMKAKPGMPVWRMEGDRPISLVITVAGRKAIGADEEEQAPARPLKVSNASESSQSRGRSKARSKDHASTASADMQAPRAGSKQALLIEMMGVKTGATLDALIEATGWLPHTTRAALTGLRKRGYTIERTRDGEVAVYRIVGKASASAAA
ncbi:DUF3489 domain-containing protein [Methylocystis rosea]|uniref:DUF3489 domain-containing protein n=1 Tax=Methylocystis rosea TaxID=173366 RepID=UPI000367FF43|nr:DUF3489 domain-containing protein [Methylocystis rosea]